jgi:type IV pilus assembly protein PilC
MSRFRYEALDAEGRSRRGVLEAESIEEANRTVFSMNLHTLRLSREAGSGISFSFGDFLKRFHKLRTDELILFTKQLATTIRVGISITQCLKTLEVQTESKRLRAICHKLHESVEQGESLSAAMSRHREAFSPMYCSIIAAGETTGTLPEVMNRLIYLIEHEARVRSDVRTAMRYPLMVVGALLVAFVIMIAFVIPKFVGFFARSNLELPWPTRACLWLSNTFTGNLPFVILGLLVAAGAYLALNQTGSGRLARDRMLLRIPLLNQVLIKAAMTRFASIFAILQASGVMILESFRILSETVGNAAIARQFDDLGGSLQEGRGIAGPLQEARYFPPLLVSMVAIGEETGQLDEMLQKISNHYDEELRYQMKKMSDAIGPLLIVGLTAVIGFFALAIYLPMWDLTRLAQ